MARQLRHGDGGPYTPLVWQSKVNCLASDANHNHVDDRLDTVALQNPEATANVIVLLASWPDPGEIASISAYSSRGVADYVGMTPTLIVLSEVSVGDLAVLAQRPLVWAVQRDDEWETALDVSVAHLQIASSPVYPTNTVRSRYPQIDGAGVNLAFIDTGIDDGQHEGLPAAKFIAGWDAAGTSGNPDDTDGHGTAVAAVAIGTGGPRSIYRGVAPGARLVDMKVSKSGQGRRTSDIIIALQECIRQRQTWNIGVVNLSLATAASSSIASDGNDGGSQTVNTLVMHDIVVVCPIGNIGVGQSNNVSLVAEFAAAEDALTVAGSDDAGSIHRSNSVIHLGSRSGPRRYGGQKPDVAAPGRSIRTALFNSSTGYVNQTGTSFAAAHVAGLAALIRQAQPNLDARAVKQLILDTAEDKGAVAWDPLWGHGLVNGFAAIHRLLGPPPPPVVVSNLPPLVTLATNLPVPKPMTIGRTDLRFTDHQYSPFPANIYSKDLFAASGDIEDGKVNTIVARVFNAGPNAARDFIVRIGVYQFSNGDKDYPICDIKVPGPIPPLTSINISCPWTPRVSGVPPGVIHACLHAHIISADDPDDNNNHAQRNIDIKQTQSPATTQFFAENPTQRDKRIRFSWEPLDETGWNLQVRDEFGNFVTGVEMGADECPRQLELIATPGAGAIPAVEIPIRFVAEDLDDPELVPPLEIGGLVFRAEIGTPNEPPVAASDSYAVPPGRPLIVTAPGPLGNDSDPEGKPLFMVPVTQPAHGRLMTFPNGSFIYEPEPRFAGIDEFSYIASDGRGRSTPSVVRMEVHPLSDLSVTGIILTQVGPDTYDVAPVISLLGGAPDMPLDWNLTVNNTSYPPDTSHTLTLIELCPPPPCPTNSFCHFEINSMGMKKRLRAPCQEVRIPTSNGVIHACLCSFRVPLWPKKSVIIPPGGSIAITIDPHHRVPEVNENNNVFQAELSERPAMGLPTVSNDQLSVTITAEPNSLVAVQSTSDLNPPSQWITRNILTPPTGSFMEQLLPLSFTNQFVRLVGGGSLFGKVDCATQREIYKNLSTADVHLTVDFSDQCAGQNSDLRVVDRFGGIVAPSPVIVRDGASVRIALVVPPGGSVSGLCLGAGSGCPFKVTIREDIKSTPLVISVACGTSASPIYRNLKGAAVSLHATFVSRCTGQLSLVTVRNAQGGVVVNHNIQPGAEMKLTLPVPAGGSIEFQCAGAGGDGCSYWFD